MMTDDRLVRPPAPRTPAEKLAQAERALRAIDHDHRVQVSRLNMRCDHTGVAAEMDAWRRRRQPVAQRVHDLGGVA